MRPKFISLAKGYLMFFGLINLYHLVSVLGFNETLVSAPLYFNLLGWNILLSLVYGMFPIITVLKDNEKSYLILTGVSLIRILLDALNVFTWVTNLVFIFVLLNSFSAILSLYIAVENSSIRIAAEFLAIEWAG